MAQRFAGSIRSAEELTPTRYLQLLNKLIDEPVTAQRLDPVTVIRLRRRRGAEVGTARPAQTGARLGLDGFSEPAPRERATIAQ